MDNEYLGIIWDDVCDMVEDAQRIRDDALVEIKEEEEQLAEETEYWGRGFLPEACRVTVALEARRDAVIGEFDTVEWLATKIENLIVHTIIELFDGIPDKPGQ